MVCHMANFSLWFTDWQSIFRHEIEAHGQARVLPPPPEHFPAADESVRAFVGKSGIASFRTVP